MRSLAAISTKSFLIVNFRRAATAAFNAIDAFNSRISSYIIAEAASAFSFEEGKKNYDNFIELVFLLEEIFDKKVDLLRSESMSPYLKPYILKEIEFETI